MSVQSLTGSLSDMSRDIQATDAGRKTEANHWVTTVVLP